MKQLEELARKSFNNFCNKNNARTEWHYLLNDRKLQWMKEILDLNKIIVDSIKLDMKEVPGYKVGMSGLEAGVNEGRRKERMLLKQQLDDYYNSIVEEYNNFSSNSRKKK